jgi:hypothetical protein
MSEQDSYARPYNPLEVYPRKEDIALQGVAIEFLEQAELRVPITDIPYARRMRVVTEAGDFEFQAIPWSDERLPEPNKPLLCVRRNNQNELDDLHGPNYFVLEGMSVGRYMRTPDDVGCISPGFSLRYRPLKVEHQQISLEYQMANKDERKMLHEAGWARVLNGHPVFITPDVEPHFTQPVVHFDAYGVDQVPARFF